MILEIDSSNIIATLIEQHGENENHQLECRKIMYLAMELEKRIPTLLTYSDMLSIDAFRSAFNKNVELSQGTLLIERYSEIRYKVERLLPSNNLATLINDINSLLNEKNT